MFHTAVIFAATAHVEQLRKGTSLPYIIHPMEVAQILSGIDTSEEVLIAGVLHDVLEDTDVSYSDIQNAFGDKIAMIVESCSNSHTASWKERKLRTINKIATTGVNVALVLSADKLSNLRSIVYDLSVSGEIVWQRFSATKDDVIWYYTELGKAISQRNEIPVKIKAEYAELVKKLQES